MTTSTSTDNPRIVIVGAGPGGLLAARVLQRAGVPVTVVDADGSIGDRDPGGTLDLHADTGQLALKIAGLNAEFAELARPEGQQKRLVDAATGAVIKNFIPDPGEYAAPEIDRGQLRTLLYESLEPGNVHWGRKLAGIEPSIDGWMLQFADGHTETAGLVIGADGAWSRVRPAITDARPGYTGVSFVELLFTDVDRRHPEVAVLVGDGHLWANGDSRNVILQRNSNQVVRGYLGTRIELDWLARAGLGEHDGRGGIRLDANGLQTLDTIAVRTAIRAELLRRFGDFAPELQRLIIESEGVLANRPIFALPAPLRWNHVSGVTLLGDAAHLMSPFGGNGVNFALLDAALLAQAVVRALRDGSDVDQSLTDYESAMFERTGPAAVAANDAITRKYRAGGSAIADIPDFTAEFARWNQAAQALTPSPHSGRAGRP